MAAGRLDLLSYLWMQQTAKQRLVSQQLQVLRSEQMFQQTGSSAIDADKPYVQINVCSVTTNGKVQLGASSDVVSTEHPENI